MPRPEPPPADPPVRCKRCGSEKYTKDYEFIATSKAVASTRTGYRSYTGLLQCDRCRLRFYPEPDRVSEDERAWRDELDRPRRERGAAERARAAERERRAEYREALRAKLAFVLWSAVPAPVFLLLALGLTQVIRSGPHEWTPPAVWVTLTLGALCGAVCGAALVLLQRGGECESIWDLAPARVLVVVVACFAVLCGVIMAGKELKPSYYRAGFAGGILEGLAGVLIGGLLGLVPGFLAYGLCHLVKWWLGK